MANEELQFDEKAMNYPLAEKYIRDHEKVVKIDTKPVDYKDLLYTRFFKLAELIEENTELFAQLGSYITNVPESQIKKIDLNLIKNHLLYHGHVNKSYLTGDEVLFVDTTIAYLGRLVNWNPVVPGSVLTISVPSKMYPIGFLFTDLCHKAGLTSVALECHDLEGTVQVNEFKNGCLGIITARSDLQSAIDMFLETPTDTPFALRKIWVEESIADNFKNAMKWKTSNQTLDEEISSQCNVAYSYENKLFLYECAAAEPARTDRHLVYIETYRTVKELFNLYDPTHVFVSLWCSDVAQSNEIAHTLTNHIIWINDFNNFSLPKIAETFYSVFNFSKRRRVDNNFSAVDEINKLKREWMKKTLGHRKSLMCDVFRDHDMGKQLERCDVSDDGVVSVRGAHCVALYDVPNELVYGEEICLDLIVAMIRGCGVVFGGNREVLEETALVEVGAPLVRRGDDSCGGRVYDVSPEFYKRKAIVNNFGSVFAN